MNNPAWELKHLRAILAIDEAKTITAAAEQLNITQSSLSRRVAHLENLLGKKIYHRLGKKMLLTNTGKTLLNLAKEIWPLCQETQQSILMGPDKQKTSIRLATQCFTCYHWLPELTKSLSQDINLKVVTESTESPNDALVNGEIDLAIANNPCHHKNVKTKHLFKDEYFAVVASDHPWARKKFIEPTDCIKEDFFQYSSQSRAIDEFLYAHQIKPNSLTSIPLTGTILQMVSAGLGVSLLSEWVLNGKLKTNEWVAIPLGKNGLFRQWFVSYLEDDVIAIKDKIAEELKEINQRSSKNQKNDQITD